MKYFQSMPTVIMLGPNKNLVAAVNLMARVSVVTELFRDPLLYYEYDIQDGDTPEIIASKYYGDVYRYWIVLFANQILDPQWEWPLSYKQFEVFINDKYASVAANNNMTPLAYTQTTIYEYRKTIQITDVDSGQTKSNNYTITQTDYIAAMPVNETVSFPNGSNSIYVVTKTPMTIYDWENEQNENKRTIKLINNTFVGKIEQELVDLLSR